MTTAWKPLLFSLACPCAGPSWDLDQKVPRAPDSEVANPVLSCPCRAGITCVWAAGVLACGEPHLGPRDQCSGLCQLQWLQQLCTSACSGMGVPRAPPGPPGTHRDAHIHATGSLLALPANLPAAPSPARSGDMDNLLGHRTQGIYMCQGASGMCTINNQDTQTPKHDTADRL